MKRIILFLIVFTLVAFAYNIKVIDKKLISDKIIIKNPSYLSAGNNNGNIDAGEKIRMKIALKAEYGDFISTSAKFSTDDKYIKLKTKKINYNDIKEGQSVWGNSPLVFEISKNCPHNHIATFNVKIYDSGKKNQDNEYIVFKDYINIKVSKVGPIEYSGVIIDDDDIGQSEGNGNQIIEKVDGDIEIPLILKNKGEANVTNAEVTLTSKKKWIRISESVKPYEVISATSEGGTPADYVFKMLKSAPRNSVPFLPMKLKITGYYGKYKYNWVHNFRLGKFFGKLDIKVNEPDAEITINGQYRNSGKLKEKRAVDDYKIEIKKYGYITEYFEVPVKENKTTYVKVNMCENIEPIKPFVETKPLTEIPSFESKNWSHYYDFNMEKTPRQIIKKGRFYTGKYCSSVLCIYTGNLIGIGIIFDFVMMSKYEGKIPAAKATDRMPTGNEVYSNLAVLTDKNYLCLSFATLDKDLFTEAYDMADMETINFNKKLKEEAKNKANEYNIYQQEKQLSLIELKIEQLNEKTTKENNKISKVNEQIMENNKKRIENRKIKYKIGKGKYIDITPNINSNNKQYDIFKIRNF